MSKSLLYPTIILIILFTTIKVNAKNIKENSSKTFTSNTIILDKESFAEKICDYKTNSKEWKYIGDKPAIIDFYADWCGPCKILSPRLEDIAAEYQDSIYVYKINIDEQKELAAMFNIRSIPTLLFIPMNANPQITQGLLPKETIKDVVADVLLKKEIDNTTMDIEMLEDTKDKVDSLNITQDVASSSMKKALDGKFKRSKADVEKLKKK